MLAVEDWVEVRRLRRAQGLAILEIARVLDISWKGATETALNKRLPTIRRPQHAERAHVVQGWSSVFRAHHSRDHCGGAGISLRAPCVAGLCHRPSSHRRAAAPVGRPAVRQTGR